MRDNNPNTRKNNHFTFARLKIIWLSDGANEAIIQRKLIVKKLMMYMRIALVVDKRVACLLRSESLMDGILFWK